MKIRSTPLYEYLLACGALNGTTEDIAIAKREYRRKYKRNWKKNKKLPHKELRPYVSLKEYERLKQVSADAGYANPTAFLKQLILSSIEGTPVVPQKEKLMLALQYIGMALTGVLRSGIMTDTKQLEDYLSIAEGILLSYVRENR